MTEVLAAGLASVGLAAAFSNRYSSKAEVRDASEIATEHSFLCHGQRGDQIALPGKPRNNGAVRMVLPVDPEEAAWQAREQGRCTPTVTRSGQPDERTPNPLKVTIDLCHRSLGSLLHSQSACCMYVSCMLLVAACILHVRCGRDRMG